MLDISEYCHNVRPVINSLVGSIIRGAKYRTYFMKRNKKGDIQCLYAKKKLRHKCIVAFCLSSTYYKKRKLSKKLFSLDQSKKVFEKFSGF